MQKKRALALLLAVIMALSLTVPSLAAEDSPVPPTPTRAEHALQLAATAAEYGQASAIQYAIWEDGELTITGGTGVYSKTENRAMTADLLYGIGSVSKIYTTAAVMKLVEAGKINLDRPVTQYLPDFKMADARYTKITVRMLLNHSAGLMGGSTNDAFLFGDTDQVATDTLLSRLSTQRLKAEPGQIAVYSNDGFTLAELVVEAVSGQDFAAYLQENILKPAKLNDTFVPQDSFDTRRLVKTYQSTDSTRALAQDVLGIVGCGGMYATAGDLASFGGALTNGSILSASSTNAMANPEYKNGIWPPDDMDSIAYGLGWDSVKYYPFATSGIQALVKGGDTLYYHAGLVVLPEHNMAAAVVSSGGVSTYNQMAAAEMLVAALKEKGVVVDQTAPTLPAATAAQMPAALTAHSGYYVNATQQMKITIAPDGKMTLHQTSSPDAADQIFTYHSDGTFRDSTGQVAVSFVTERNALTYMQQKYISPIPVLGYLPISQYAAQKLSPNEVAPEIQSAWDNLIGLPFLPVNMKYTSQLYLALGASSAAAAPESIEGYVAGLLIVDAVQAQSVAQIPNTAGRDSQDLVSFTQDGLQFYTNTQGIIYRQFSDLTDIYAANRAYCTIGENGYARWFSIAEKDIGKKMTVTISGKGGFTAYDGTGSVTASSAAYGDISTTLPSEGILAFAGEPGTRFTLSFDK